MLLILDEREFATVGRHPHKLNSDKLKMSQIQVICGTCENIQTKNFSDEIILTWTIRLLKPSTSLLAVRALQCLRFGFLRIVVLSFPLTLVLAFQLASAEAARAPAEGSWGISGED